MISGEVTEDGVPEILMSIAGRNWPATIDTGFNGYLELPAELKGPLNPVFRGRIETSLAGGQVLSEDSFDVEVHFDGQTRTVEVTFVDSEEILIGTHLMEDHLLEIDFPNRTLQLKRLQSGNGQLSQG